MNRLEKLQQILEIAITHKNPDMEANVRRHIEEEKRNPSDITYPDATDSNESA
jgi:hypothetical protein